MIKSTEEYDEESMDAMISYKSWLSFISMTKNHPNLSLLMRVSIKLL